MTARHLVELICANYAQCGRTFPLSEDGPAEGLVGPLRDLASAAGWEVMNGKHGRDMCPACRIDEIEAKVDKASGGKTS